MMLRSPLLYLTNKFHYSSVIFNPILRFVPPTYPFHLNLRTKMTTHTTQRIETAVLPMGAPIVHTVPIFQDNYAYILCDPTAPSVGVLIDPADAFTVWKVATELGVQPIGILCTHWHPDHSGGNQWFNTYYPNLPIYGGHQDPIPFLSQPKKNGEMITVGSLQIEVLAAPCHTQGHVLYFVEPPTPNTCPLLFTGDTLFVGGCGKFTEGTAQEMYRALYETIGSLPGDTQFFCGHEYTINNLRFALSIEPQNLHITRKLRWAEKQIQDKRVTVPSLISQEKEYNPFMRVHLPAFQKNIPQAKDLSKIEILGHVRKLKNAWKGK